MAGGVAGVSEGFGGGGEAVLGKFGGLARFGGCDVRGGVPVGWVGGGGGDEAGDLGGEGSEFGAQMAGGGYAGLAGEEAGPGVFDALEYSSVWWLPVVEDLSQHAHFERPWQRSFIDDRESMPG